MQPMLALNLRRSSRWWIIIIDDCGAWKSCSGIPPPFIKQQWRDLRLRRNEALARERGLMSAVRIILFGVNPPAPVTSRLGHVTSNR
jgi:hypothetical protein